MSAPADQADAIKVENPASGALITTVPLARADDVVAAVARARDAQPAWQALGFEGRSAVMRRAARWMFDNAQRVIGAVVSETGKTYEDAQSTDFGYTVQALSFWASHARRYLADERVSAWHSPVLIGKRLTLRHVPVGVVGVIGPWNFPLVNGFGDCIPALMAGNSVVLKPSEVTPTSSLLMAEMFSECGLAPDVFQVLVGDGSIGAAVVANVDCVVFTGSTRTGRLVATAAAEALTPCYLELGGNDPMIVCADADVEKAARAATYYSMNNAGQVCTSVERVYVEAAVYDRFVARVTALVGALRQGPPGGPGSVDVGAVTFAPQLDTVSRHVRDALSKGARVLTGGFAHTERGRFYDPTVLVDVDHRMDVMREETFGPVMPIMRVDDVEQAIKLANDSPYGLQATVFTRDLARAAQIARRLEAGTVCVNTAQLNYFALRLPMGGWKSSGVGTRHGAAGIRKYCRTQAVCVSVWGPRRELFMFPYRAWTSRLLLWILRLLYGRGRVG
ncbi:MAG: aldehyde dehydrogenase family protein [Solirubrobacteraceae bacterium]